MKLWKVFNFVFIQPLRVNSKKEISKSKSNIKENIEKLKKKGVEKEVNLKDINLKTDQSRIFYGEKFIKNNL